MKRTPALALVPIMLLAACEAAATATSAPVSTAPARRTLTVFAAATLTDAFGELGRAFEAAHPGVTVKFNFAGSQTLQGQIALGAPADIFASANATYMDAAAIGGFVDKAASQEFLTNSLVVILPASNPAKVRALKDLSKPGLKVVLADAAAPAGTYARQILDNMSVGAAFGADFGTRVLANVVSNETDVRQVLAKVQLGEADAGIVYASDAMAAPGLKTLEIPANVNVVAKYPIAPLLRSANADLAGEFVAYVLSSEGQATLRKWGFTPIE